MGSIILTAFSSKGYLLLLCILQRLMRFTQSLFPIICSANLGGNSLFFCWPLCTLVLVTVSEFPIDGSSNAWPLQRFTNHHLRCIQYRIKEIRVIPFHCVFSEFIWNNYFSLYVKSSLVFLHQQKEPFWYLAHVYLDFRKGSYRWYYYMNLKDK